MISHLTTYTYNTDKTLATKTDAKNQQFSYTYDGYKRVTQINLGQDPCAGGTRRRAECGRDTPDSRTAARRSVG